MHCLGRFHPTVKKYSPKPFILEHTQWTFLSDRKSNNMKGEQDRLLYFCSSYKLWWKTRAWKSLNQTWFYIGRYLFSAYNFSKIPAVIPSSSNTELYWQVSWTTALVMLQMVGILGCIWARHNITRNTLSGFEDQQAFKITEQLSLLLRVRTRPFSTCVSWAPDYHLCCRCIGRITYFHFLLEFAY